MELLLSFIAGLFLGLIIGLYKITNIITSPKTRGNLGEIALERILEVSGLQKGIHYLSQESCKSDENKLLRPDVIICLPNNRHVVIDSKVSLEVKTIREQIKNLKSKFYEEIKELNTPDFVIMFIPVESVFADIMRKDSNIFEFAWKNKVLITSPSTLLATIKTIELTWQKENQAKNVIEIAEESGRLYDKFAGLINDIELVKGHFAKVLNSFDDMNKKIDGRGGLLTQAEKLKALGAKASKQLPDKNYL